MAIGSSAVGLSALAIAVAVYLLSHFSNKGDSREPPIVQSRIPFIGHIIGLITEGGLYFKRISERCKHPIFTLPMLNGRTYVVASPSLAMSVQRAAATLDFDQLVADMTPRLVGASKDTIRILQDATAKQEGRVRLVSKSHHVINPPLGLSKISEILSKQFRHFSRFVNRIRDGDEVELFKLVTREVTNASMETFYGPHSPFVMHPELVEKYWDWDDGVVGYAIGILPQLTARKAYYGGEAVIKGFQEYTEKGFHKESIQMLQDRKKLHEDAGLSQDEHARLELGISFGFNSNASITSFWVLDNIFSRPDLLKEIREEIFKNAFEAPATISGPKLREACPLLNSVIRETLRLIAPMTSARVVLEDTILADTYLLRKGNIVQIAGGILHSDTDIWGPDASSFNARRFLHSLNGSKSNADGSVSESKANLAHPAAFRGFGGGTSLCPGRHFAQIEMLGLVASIVSAFDMVPVTGMATVEWNPARDDKKFPIAAIKPLRGVNVKLKKRDGYQHVDWVLQA